MKRVFIGYNNVAGIGISLKKGFLKNGINAEFYSFEKTKHKFDYNKDDEFITIRHSRFSIIRYPQLLLFIFKLIIKYDYFIFLPAGSSILSKRRDISILRFFGKKTINIFVGCDSRIPEIVEPFKWNPCKDCNDEYKWLVNCKIKHKKELIRDAEKKYHFISSPYECGGYLLNDFHRALFPLDIDKIRNMFFKNKPKNKNKLKIVHAPSHYHVKGTRYINKVMSDLQKKYSNIEYILLSGVSKDSVYELISESDLIIDQMLVGFYGLLSIEAMALSKPVVCYIREDIWNSISKYCPIINANPDNLMVTLESIFTNPALLEELGEKSFTYVKKYHDCKIIAKQYFEIFEGL
jgi:glycosyltransferase involved in cell wall biosynthesis